MKREKALLHERIWASLAYILPPISPLVCIISNRRSEYVLFHSVNAIIIPVFLGLNYIVWQLFPIYTFQTPMPKNFIEQVFFVVLVVSGFVYKSVYFYALLFILWLAMIYKAYNGEKIHLPFFGKLALKYCEMLKK